MTVGLTLFFFLQDSIQGLGAAPAAALLDPTVVIEADGDEDAKKTLKTLAFPTMDDDGLPSSYAQKGTCFDGKVEGENARFVFL